jgi:ATP-dependent helicase/nuclease subunit B
MAHIRLFSGPSRSGRARAVDDVLCRHWGQAVLLLPTRQFARERTERLLLDRDLPGVWGSPVQTFQDFAAGLLKSSGVFVKPIGMFERRLLLERAIQRMRDEGRLTALGAAAETAGFANHVLRTITQLKQAAIDPPQFRDTVARRARKSWLDAVVADVYDAYQGALQDEGAYDLVGVYWTAALACQQGRPPMLERVRTVLLDGFDDFTPSEFRLLQAMQTHVDTLVFGINCERDMASQQDLYALPVTTARRIQNDFAHVESQSFREAAPRTFTEFAATEIFWRTPPKRPDGLEANLELMPCAGAAQEAETIGRRVKSLLVDDGVPADRIAIVYRDIGGAAGLIRAIFHEFGIPLNVQHPPSLAESAVCAFLLNVLDAAQSWKREQVIDVVVSPWYQPGEGTATPEYRSAAPLLARMAGIVGGQSEWSSQLEYLRKRIESGLGKDVESLAARLDNATGAVDWLLRQIELLVGLGKGLPEKASLRRFVAGVDKIINECGVEKALAGGHFDPATLEAERIAHNALRVLLERLRHWRSPQGDGGTLSRTEFLSLLRDALDDTTYAPPENKHGVVCIDAERIRHLSFDHVFFAGVNEGAVPRPPATSAIYSDEDVLDFRDAGVAIDDKHTHSNREVLLFRHVLDVAREHLCISWRTHSPDGKPLAASPFVADLRELFNGELQAPPVPPDAFVPELSQAASWRDLCNIAFMPTGSPLRDVIGGEFTALRHGVAIEDARQRKAAFDCYDGMLSDASAVEPIAKRYGESHQFSASQAETYAQCPFRFFVERVLGTEPVETPSNEFDARDRGSIMHEVLQRFHSTHRGQPVAAIPVDEAESTMAALVAEVFARRSQSAPQGVVAAEKYRMTTLMRRYLTVAREKDRDWAPVHFEVAFGTQKGPEGEPPSRTEPYAMETPEGDVLFSGRIDRIDEGDGGLRIIDYKTSIQTAQKDIKAGVSMQLGIYALALEGLLLPDAVCTEARFLQVGKDKTVEALARNKKTPEWDDRQTVLRDKVGEVVRGIREGRFPPDPYESSCTYCPARQTCRYEPARVDRKKRGAP